MERVKILWREKCRGNDKYFLWEEKGKLHIGVFHIDRVLKRKGEKRRKEADIERYLFEFAEYLSKRFGHTPQDITKYAGDMRLRYPRAWESIPEDLRERLMVEECAHAL